METYRDVISSIRSMNKLLSGDNLINDRVVMSEVMTSANILVGQSLSKRKYWQSPNIFTPVKCLEMEQVPLSKCCEYIGEKKISVSKKSLPKIGEGIFGLAIQGVFGLDGSVKYNQTNPNRYSNLLKLNPDNLDRFFWINSEGKVVVTNEDAAKIDIYAYFTEPVPNDLLFPNDDCDCSQSFTKENLCMNPLDQPMRFPSERLYDLKQLVYKNLLSNYFGVTQDITANQIDETQKR